MAAVNQQTVQAALAALQGQRLADAERLFRKVLRNEPNHVQALNLLTIVLCNLKRYAEAERFIARAISLRGDSDASFSNYGQILMRLRRPQEALLQFDKAIALNDKVAESWSNRGSAYSELQDYKCALTSFDQAIMLRPDYAEAYCNKAKSLCNLGRYAESQQAYQKAVSLRPNLAEAWIGLGSAFAQQRRAGDALAALQKASQISPSLAEPWFRAGDVFLREHRHADALSAYDRALALQPDLLGVEVARGSALIGLERFDEALAAYDGIIAKQPNMSEAWLGRSEALLALKRLDEASFARDRALQLRPDFAEAWLAHGNALARRKDVAALDAFDRALKYKPDLVGAWVGRGNVLRDLSRYDEAAVAYDKAIKFDARLPEALLGRANVLHDLKLSHEALLAYDEVLAIKHDVVEAWLGRGNLLHEFKRHEEAFAAYDRALSLKPGFAEAWTGRGNIFIDLRCWDEAFASYDKAVRLQPDLALGAGRRLYSKLHLCDWTDLCNDIEHILQATGRGETAIAPFESLVISSSAATQLECAKRFVQNQPPFEPIWHGEVYSHDRIRIAYLSADFHNHATAHLAAGLFEKHDKNCFEVTAISFGPDDNSELRQRLKSSFERFEDVRARDDQEIARLIQRLEIDIAVDLKGYTTDNRHNIFGRRPAPVQVNYLGYPGTMGAKYIDYIIADSTIIPENHFKFYTERVAWLPNCYQVNDDQRLISSLESTRRQHGLPDGSFVFCCFNNVYKIQPEMFDLWMRLLRATENSVIWLLPYGATARANLCREAERRGISADRLIFAQMANQADHLARHQHADLFLDTLPVNAHTTASDALWAGLPVLTCPGDTFIGRVAASLLRAINLPELIASSLEEYEALAIELALNRERLKNVREKLVRNRLTTPLFDTLLYTEHLESAYKTMYQRYQSGLPPDHVGIEAFSHAK